MQFMVYWQIYSGDRWTTKSLVSHAHGRRVSSDKNPTCPGWMCPGHSDVVRFEVRAALQVSKIDESLRFLDLCHSAFIAVAIWDSVIASYGDSAKVDAIPWCVVVIRIYSLVLMDDEHAGASGYVLLTGHTATVD